jgi:argininosuccinate lyase
VHLGRSRNDQVLVAQRLFILAELRRIRENVVKAAETALELARCDQDTPMPGYTHLQRAVPSTVGLWMASFVESFADDLELLDLTAKWLDASPLGTAAGYGVNVALDRQRVATKLGFDRFQVNPMHTQGSRGKHELQALGVCWQIAQDVRRLAWDISLFSTAEFGFVTCGEAVTTGSSIMPNKRNPDLAELLRAAAGPVAACMTELQQVLSLPSGYHRDLQMTKAPVIRGLVHTRHTIELVPVLLESITLDRDAMRQAIDPDMHATDRAVELAASGVPFRDAYKQAASELGGGSPPRSPEDSVAARVSPGACADLRLDELAARIT